MKQKKMLSLLLAAAPFPNYDSKNGEFLWRSTAEN